MPHALQLGLRYVAHIVQENTHPDLLMLTFPQTMRDQLELQVFSTVNEAEEW